MRQSGADESTVRAYELKDKLLQFDRETAKRTQVLDAQSDYYTSSTWLDEEEKAAIDAKEKARMISVQRLNRPVEQLELDLATGYACFGHYSVSLLYQRLHLTNTCYLIYNVNLIEI